MGMLAKGKTITVSMNWTLCGKLLDILDANGFTGNLPRTNDGETVDKETAKQVGRAVLKWWEQKEKAAFEERMVQHPHLTPGESAILAYALLLAVDDGEVEHL